MKRLISTMLFVLLPSHIALSQESHTSYDFYEACQINRQTTHEETIQDYTISIGHADEQMCHFIEIKKGNDLVFYEEDIGGHYYLGTSFLERKNAILNLTENTQELVVSKWTGGAHCCFSTRIFRLADNFAQLNHIDGGNFHPEFTDMDNDGKPEIQITDDFLAYIFSSFAFSAAGHVVFKYIDGRYQIFPPLMIKPLKTISKKTMLKIQADLKNANIDNDLPYSFVQTVTDLVFAGHKKEALDFINEVWPADIRGKNEFISTYEEYLRESKLYEAFETALQK